MWENTEWRGAVRRLRRPGGLISPRSNSALSTSDLKWLLDWLSGSVTQIYLALTALTTLSKTLWRGETTWPQVNHRKCCSSPQTWTPVCVTLANTLFRFLLAKIVNLSDNNISLLFSLDCGLCSVMALSAGKHRGLILTTHFKLWGSKTQFLYFRSLLDSFDYKIEVFMLHVQE